MGKITEYFNGRQVVFGCFLNAVRVLNQIMLLFSKYAVMYSFLKSTYFIPQHAYKFEFVEQFEVSGNCLVTCFLTEILVPILSIGFIFM